MNVTSISDFRKDTKKYFDQVVDNYDDLIVLRSDGKKVVIIPFDTYNSIKETEYLLNNSANARHLEKSMAQLRAGKVIKKTMAELRSYE